ncbi:hypothetical protein ACLE0S_002849 [Cronobacter malonaticus]
MKNIFTLASLVFVSMQAMSAEKAIYLSCPYFDSRTPDLIVVLDQSNGLASLQSPSMGSGLNFTAPASFGPDKVTWRKDSKSLKQTYSVDRSSLIFERKTYSEMTSDVHSDKSKCNLVKKPESAKF